MNTSPKIPRRPPVETSYAGKPRRVGVEIEFARLSCDGAAQVVKNLFGGVVKKHSDYKFDVKDTSLGDFAVEMDFALIHKIQEESPGPVSIESDDLGQVIKEGAQQVLGQVGDVVVPNEITCPPILIDDISKMDDLVRALDDAGAADTSDNIVYGFGLQLNPEVVSTEASSILRYMQSFMLLNEWLRAEIQVDPTRRLLPFADPFPMPYRARILKNEYHPTQSELIDDYLAENLTRNRDLDMLPLFTFLDEDRVSTAIDDGLTKSRPTFHYRLPNCKLNDPEWSVSVEWTRWLEVERLAEEPGRLRAMADAWLKREWEGSLAEWVASVRDWLVQ